LAIDEALTRTEGDTTLAYLGDILGSTVALADASGVPVTTYTYAPFGETSVSGAASSNPFRFTGREDDGSGLYYYRARYYDHRTMRFLSEDLFGLLANPNLYRYARNNPLRYLDPLGLFTIIGGLGGSAIAGKGVEASAGGYYNWNSGEAGGFVSVGGGAGLNASGDIFGGVVWGDLEGVTANTNVVLGPISISVMLDPMTGKPMGFTVGIGPLIPGIPWGGLSETISVTGTGCVFNCPSSPPVDLGCRK
jgi:RHS repeat-associated protein